MDEILHQTYILMVVKLDGCKNKESKKASSLDKVTCDMEEQHMTMASHRDTLTDQQAQASHAWNNDVYLNYILLSI